MYLEMLLKEYIKEIQDKVGTLLYYGHAVDSILTATLSSNAICQALKLDNKLC